MNVEIKDIITLDNANKYIVVSRAVYNDETYFFLVNTNQNDDSKILKLDKTNGELFEFDDKNLFNVLTPLFLEETVKVLNAEDFETSEE